MSAQALAGNQRARAHIFLGLSTASTNYSGECSHRGSGALPLLPPEGFSAPVRATAWCGNAEFYSCSPGIS